MVALSMFVGAVVVAVVGAVVVRVIVGFVNMIVKVIVTVEMVVIMAMTVTMIGALYPRMNTLPPSSISSTLTTYTVKDIYPDQIHRKTEKRDC